MLGYCRKSHPKPNGRGVRLKNSFSLTLPKTITNSRLSGVLLGTHWTNNKKSPHIPGVLREREIIRKFHSFEIQVKFLESCT
jgi:hypothetical protein